jgi:hypothetical protein
MFKYVCNWDGLEQHLPQIISVDLAVDQLENFRGRVKFGNGEIYHII